MNGVSWYLNSRQFISLDGTRSAFEVSGRKDREWTDHIIPQGTQIRTVETLLRKKNGKLYGFKWIGDDGAVLIKFGDIDDPGYRNDPLAVVTRFTLNHNQRLVGVRSGSGGYK